MGQLRVRRVTLSGDPRCPLCREGLDAPADELAVCRGCDAVHHRECVEELGGGACATLGCGQPLTTRHVVVPRAEEVAEDGRTILLIPHDAGFLRGAVTMLAMAFGCFGFVCVFVHGIAERRWPMSSLLIAALLPLVAYGARELWRAWRRGRRRRRPRPHIKGK